MDRLATPKTQKPARSGLGNESVQNKQHNTEPDAGPPSNSDSPMGASDPQRSQGKRKYVTEDPQTADKKREKKKVSIGEDSESGMLEDDEGKAKVGSKPFPMMRLPPELRLEVFRVCLTRPYQIILSKRESRQEWDEGYDEEENAAFTSTILPIVGNSAFNNVSVPAEVSTITWHPQNGRTRSARRNLNAARPLRTPDNDDARPAIYTQAPREVYPQDADPLNTALLRVSRTLCKEARDVLYGENTFALRLPTAVSSLTALHQRSRRLIKHIHVTIPTSTEILDDFSDLVRLSLRYCSGLRRLVVHAPFQLPPPDSSSASPSTVYANGFEILRWLPQPCQVVVVGNSSAEIASVVARHLELARTLDKFAYARRQLTAYESERA